MFPVEGHQAQAIQAHNLHLLLLLLLGSLPVLIGRCLEGSHQRRRAGRRREIGANNPYPRHEPRGGNPHPGQTDPHPSRNTSPWSRGWPVLVLPGPSVRLGHIPRYVEGRKRSGGEEILLQHRGDGQPEQWEGQRGPFKIRLFLCVEKPNTILGKADKADGPTRFRETHPTWHQLARTPCIHSRGRTLRSRERDSQTAK